MKEMVTLSKKKLSRLMVLNEIEVGRITGREAAELLALSLRHVRRILTAYRKEGAAALAHGSRGRRPHNALDRGDKVGSIEVGKRADIIVLDIPRHQQLPYWFGVNLVAKVVKNGVIIE